jgi:hypothetical protein
MGMLSIDFENIDQEEQIWDSVTEMRTETGDFSGRKSVRLDGGRYLINVETMYLGEWQVRLTKP